MPETTDNTGPAPGPPPVVVPAKPAAPALATPAKVVLALVAAAVVGYFAVAIWGRFKPGPTPDSAPKTVAIGSFWERKSDGVQATPDGSPVPIGTVRIDATGSASTRPIKVKSRGPKVALRRFTPEGAPASSIIEADVFEYGSHHFDVTSTGLVKGELDTDTATVTFPVTPPGPAPGPDFPPRPTPDPPVDPIVPVPVPANADPAFVPLGKAYPKSLALAYADAWEAGARILDDPRQPISAAIAAVGKGWDAGRTTAFDAALTPPLKKIVPESTKEADITADQRASMARAWRGIAAGLRQQ